MPRAWSGTQVGAPPLIQTRAARRRHRADLLHELGGPDEIEENYCESSLSDLHDSLLIDANIHTDATTFTMMIEITIRVVMLIFILTYTVNSTTLSA